MTSRRILFLCALGPALVSCDSSILHRDIVAANVHQSPLQPMPLLPLQSGQKVSVQGGFSQTLSAQATGGRLDDSTHSALALNRAPLGFGGIILYRSPRDFWGGLELSNGSGFLLGGSIVPKGNWLLLAYGGFGLVSYTEDVTYREIRTSTSSGILITSLDTTRSLRRVRDTILGLSASFGGAAQYQWGPLHPFAAARLLIGPRIDGKASLIDGSPVASNAIQLGEFRIDAGSGLDLASRLHLIAGVGANTSIDSKIEGVVWRGFAGFQWDYSLEDRPQVSLLSGRR